MGFLEFTATTDRYIYIYIYIHMYICIYTYTWMSTTIPSSSGTPTSFEASQVMVARTCQSARTSGRAVEIQVQDASVNLSMYPTIRYLGFG